MAQQLTVLGQQSCGAEFKCPRTHLHIKLGIVANAITPALWSRHTWIFRDWWTTGLRNFFSGKKERETNK